METPFLSEVFGKKAGGFGNMAAVNSGFHRVQCHGSLATGINFLAFPEVASDTFLEEPSKRSGT